MFERYFINWSNPGIYPDILTDNLKYTYKVRNKIKITKTTYLIKFNRENEDIKEVANIPQKSTQIKIGTYLF